VRTLLFWIQAFLWLPLSLRCLKKRRFLFLLSMPSGSALIPPRQYPFFHSSTSQMRVGRVCSRWSLPLPNASPPRRYFCKASVPRPSPSILPLWPLARFLPHMQFLLSSPLSLTFQTVTTLFPSPTFGNLTFCQSLPFTLLVKGFQRLLLAPLCRPPTGFLNLPFNADLL